MKRTLQSTLFRRARVLIGLLAVAPAGLWAQAVPDPATVSAYAPCHEVETHDFVSAQLYWPRNGSCNAAVYGPVVILLHGHGYGYDEYDYLLQHLAENGFIAASIGVVAGTESEASHEAAAQEAWEFVEDFMWTLWDKRFYMDPSRVALIGHSRGGETVRFLAHQLDGHPLWKVKAVVNLAPTNANDLFLDGRQTVGFTVIHGTADPDVSLDARFAVHDRSGSSLSQHPLAWNDRALYHSAKLIGGGNHADFADGDTDVATLTKGYVLSFLAGHLRDDVTWYDLYTRGDARPGGLSDPVTTQYRDGFLRDVVDNFQRLAVSPSSMGGSVVAKHAAASITNLAQSPDTPHYTRALSIDPAVSGGHVQWAIPAGHRNQGDKKYLSLRIGQVNGAQALSGVRARLLNAGVWSPEIELTDYGVIAQVDTMCVDGNGQACFPIADQFHLGTLRMPLQAFGAHTDVTAVRLVFRNDAVAHATFVVDDLEFSEYVLKP